MKKVLALAFAATWMVACNDADTNTDTTVNTMDTTNRTTVTTTNDNAAYAPNEGDVTYRERKVMVRRNNDWVAADDDVRMDNGTTIYRDGRVVRDGNEVRLEEGQTVDRTGRFFDRTGQAIENAWDKTKEGVKDAGKAIGNAAEKVGDKVKNAVDNDNN